MAWTSNNTFEEEVSAALRGMQRETLSMRREMHHFSQLQRESMTMLRNLLTNAHDVSCPPVAPAMHAGDLLYELESHEIESPELQSARAELPGAIEDDMETMLLAATLAIGDNPAHPATPPPVPDTPKPDRLKNGVRETLDNKERASFWRPSVMRQTFIEQSGAPKAVFDFKEQVKRQIMKPPRDVSTYYKKHGIWQQIARSSEFETATLVVISVNALWIAIDTDKNNSETLANAEVVFQIVENLFCCFFTFELFARFSAFKKKRNIVKDAWFIFDSVLVLFMVIETWVISIVLYLSTSSSGDNPLLRNVTILRMARLLRLSRMARLARIVRAVPELSILLKGMLASVRSVTTTFWLLGIVLYVFAIAFAQMTQGSDANERWHSVPYSMYTLWLYGVLCLDFAEEITDEFLAMPSLPTGIVLWLMYYGFVLLATYTIMNMLIGVLCEVVTAVAASEKEALLLLYARDKLKGILSNLDLNSDGSISESEFATLVSEKDACMLLHDLGIDVVGLLDFADVIFDRSELVEDDGEEMEIDFDEFVDLVLQLRGNSYATVKDIVELRKLVRTVIAQQTVITDHLADAGVINSELDAPILRTGSLPPSIPPSMRVGASMIRGRASSASLRGRPSQPRSGLN